MKNCIGLILSLKLNNLKLMFFFFLEMNKKVFIKWREEDEIFVEIEDFNIIEK